jgi:hypothetical protein
MVHEVQNSWMLSEDQIMRLNSHGYIVIDNFLPLKLHDNLLEELEGSKSTINYQVKPTHYSHVFQSTLLRLPQDDEVYMAKFKTIDEREKLTHLRDLFNNYLAPIMKLATNNQAKYAIYPAAVRVGGGDVFRAHQDSYAGIVGFSFFLNRGWRWDYGGILTYVRSEDIAEPIYPATNRLVLRNEKFKHFHFLNTVEQFAPKEQFIILGWADEKAADPFLYGKYHNL